MTLREEDRTPRPASRAYLPHQRGSGRWQMSPRLLPILSRILVIEIAALIILKVLR